MIENSIDQILLRGGDEWRAVKSQLPSERRKCSSNMAVSLIRGGRPTRAGPFPVRKSSSALRLVTGRGERTSVAPRGVATMWSDEDELIRSRLVACQCGAPVPFMRVAWRRKASLSEYRWVKRQSLVRVYRGRGARWQLTMTTGNSDIVRAGWSGEVRGRYKQSEIRPSCGGGTVGFTVPWQRSASLD